MPGVRPALVVLGFAGVLLVLVLMVNLASVLLARAAQREHEFAVSRALGANGGAVVRATLFEGALLGLAGGAAAALAAVWGTRALVALAPLDLPRREAVAVDWRSPPSSSAWVVLLGLARGDHARDLGGTREPVVAARQQRGPRRRRRTRPDAPRDGRRAGHLVSRAAHHRRPRRTQLRAAAARRSRLHAGRTSHRACADAGAVRSESRGGAGAAAAHRAIAADDRRRHGSQRDLFAAADGIGESEHGHDSRRARNHRQHRPRYAARRLHRRSVPATSR